MKAAREVRRWLNLVRRWLNLMRRWYGKKNGVIDGWFLDCPTMENKHASSKRNYRRNKKVEYREGD